MDNKEKLKEYKRQYYLKNKEKIRRQQAEYYADNSDEIKANVNSYRKNNKDIIDANKPKKNKRSAEYYQENKERINEYRKEYNNRMFKEDMVFKLAKKMRNSVNKSIKCKFNRKSSKTQDILGCSFEELKIHLESQFEEWMTWDNHGVYTGNPNNGWDIDHIIPISSATTYEEAIKLSHYSNLQPLCSHVNRDIKRSGLN